MLFTLSLNVLRKGFTDMINDNKSELEEYEEARNIYDDFNKMVSEFKVYSVLSALIQLMSDAIVNTSISKDVSVETFSKLIHEDILEKSNIKLSKFKNKKVH